MGFDLFLKTVAKGFWAGPTSGMAVGLFGLIPNLLPPHNETADQLRILRNAIIERRALAMRRLLERISPSIDQAAGLAEDQQQLYREFVIECRLCDRDDTSIDRIEARLLHAKDTILWLLLPQLLIAVVGGVVALPLLRVMLLGLAALVFLYQLLVCYRGCRLKRTLHDLRSRPDLLGRAGND